MRLLNAETKVLESFEGENVPDYAVLSHTWGPAQEEILFRDIEWDPTWEATTGPPQDSPKAVGWKKLIGACRQTLASDLQYIWIDTCCIDKSSSAELSEAINSMFRWYANSVVCYAYLADVYAGTNPRSEQAMEDFRESRWFTRGWTLQELLAPADVHFFDARWVNLGGKHLLRDTISEITGIPARYIHGLPSTANGSAWDPQQLIATATVAEKMSWAAQRQTTRVEDQAYCLLGIFDIAMPMLYGEGQRAFARLQEHIMVATDDCTLLAWNYDVEWRRPSGAWNWFEMKPHILAPSPAAFAHCRDIVLRKIPRHTRPTFSLTPRGLKLRVPLVVDRSHKELVYAILACGPASPPLSLAAIPSAGDVHLLFMAVPLKAGTPASDSGTDEYWRPAWSRPSMVSRDFVFGTVGAKPKATWKKIVIRRPSSEYDLVAKPLMPFSLIAPSPDTAALLQAYPPFRIEFRPVAGSASTNSAESTGTLLDKLRRGSRQGSSSNAGDKMTYTCVSTRRLIYARVSGLHLLVHLQYPSSSIPSDTFLQKLHAREWPRNPQLKVYRLPRPASVEVLQEWYECPFKYEARDTVKLAELQPVVNPLLGESSSASSLGPAETECYYWTEGPDGGLVRLRLSVSYEHREQVDRFGKTITWDFMPIIKVAYDTGDYAEQLGGGRDEEVDNGEDAWSVAETLAQD